MQVTSRLAPSSPKRVRATLVPSSPRMRSEAVSRPSPAMDTPSTAVITSPASTPALSAGPSRVTDCTSRPSSRDTLSTVTPMPT